MDKLAIFCFKCDRDLTTNRPYRDNSHMDDVEREDNENGIWHMPDGGIHFRGGNNFGSTLMDSEFFGLEIIVCDECLKQWSDKTRVVKLDRNARRGPRWVGSSMDECEKLEGDMQAAANMRYHDFGTALGMTKDKRVAFFILDHVKSVFFAIPHISVPDAKPDCILFQRPQVIHLTSIITANMPQGPYYLYDIVLDKFYDVERHDLWRYPAISTRFAFEELTLQGIEISGLGEAALARVEELRKFITSI